MKLAIRSYNNSDYISDTDFIILNLTDDNIKEINKIQSLLKEHLADYYSQVTFYSVDFEVYSEDTLKSYWSNELREWIETPSDSRDEYIILTEDWDYESIPNSYDENDIRLDLYSIKVNKNHIWCKCYTKYDNVEIYTQEINIKEL